MAEAGEGEARQGRGTKGGVIGWSHGQIVDTLASGGTVDLRGGQVRLPAPLRVEGGVQARLQNGTLVFDRFEGPAIAAQGSGSALAMSHVRVRSGVVAAEAGARLDLAEVQLESAGVVVTGAGSSLLMRNSGVTGASIGVAVVDGASGELEVVTLQGCNIGLNCERGAAVTVSGGLITGTRTGPAINVHGSSLDAQASALAAVLGPPLVASMTLAPWFFAPVTPVRQAVRRSGPGMLPRRAPRFPTARATGCTRGWYGARTRCR